MRKVRIETSIMRTLIVLVTIVSAIAGTLIILQPITCRVHAQDRLRIVIEEVQLPVAAYDNYGHFDPSLAIDDLLILENGLPQEVRSVRQIPANVVLLLDTGGEINTAKNIRTTREIAKNLVSALNPQDQVSVFQVSDKVELLQDWTRDFKQVTQVLDTKLLSGKRAHLSDGLVAAVTQFGELPMGSRHLVLITDGVETPGGKVNRTDAVKRVAASNAVVHVISYARVSREALNEAQRIVHDRNKSTTPDDVVNSLPKDPGYEHLRRLHKPGGKTVDLDPERVRRIREYDEAMTGAEWQLKFLTNETGGHFWLPESLNEMIADGTGASRLIDAEYVVTYKPKLAVISAPEGEVRRVQVASRRVGLIVVSRRNYIALGKKQL
jgi:VWFA-related protein